MPFQPGQSGNPKGRKPRQVEDQAASVLVRVFDDAAEERVIQAMIGVACDPDARGAVSAARFLFERKYGKVPDAMVVLQTGPDRAPDADALQTATRELSAWRTQMAEQLNTLNVSPMPPTSSTSTE